jgi:hypothetical protein
MPAVHAGGSVRSLRRLTQARLEDAGSVQGLSFPRGIPVTALHPARYASCRASRPCSQAGGYPKAIKRASRAMHPLSS